jgi:Leucine-rich repeat (LRR) protein
MPQLNKIDLNSNRLEGTLSNAVGSLSNLQVLQLEDNNFTGDVPADGLLQLESLGMFNEYHAWLMSPVIAINLTFCT